MTRGIKRGRNAERAPCGLDELRALGHADPKQRLDLASCSGQSDPLYYYTQNNSKHLAWVTGSWSRVTKSKEKDVFSCFLGVFFLNLIKADVLHIA